eukprot:g1657.t1
MRPPSFAELDALGDHDSSSDSEASSSQMIAPTIAAFRRPTTSFRICERPKSPPPLTIECLEKDLDDDPDKIFDSILNEEKLRQLTMTKDLTRVTQLEIKVDTSEQSIAVLGEFLPSLRQLKLNESSIASCRDLGTKMPHLKVLWLNRCGLGDIDGIGAFTGLEGKGSAAELFLFSSRTFCSFLTIQIIELYLAFNELEDIGPLALHEDLRVLDLDCNMICDTNQIDQLGTCPKLMSLSLESNPVTQIPNYRKVVVRYIPQLKILDDINVTEEDNNMPSPRTGSYFDEELMIAEGVRCGAKLDEGYGRLGAAVMKAKRGIRSAPENYVPGDDKILYKRAVSTIDVLDKARELDLLPRKEVVRRLKEWNGSEERTETNATLSNRKGKKKMMENLAKHFAQRPKKFESKSDTELVELLRAKPKEVPQLQTREAFRDFFRGIEEDRMKQLLEKALQDSGNKDAVKRRIKRRMEVMKGAFKEDK